MAKLVRDAEAWVRTEEARFELNPTETRRAALNARRGALAAAIDLRWQEQVEWGCGPEAVQVPEALFPCSVQDRAPSSQYYERTADWVVTHPAAPKDLLAILKTEFEQHGKRWPRQQNQQPACSTRQAPEVGAEHPGAA